MNNVLDDRRQTNPRTPQSGDIEVTLRFGREQEALQLAQSNQLIYSSWWFSSLVSFSLSVLLLLLALHSNSWTGSSAIGSRNADLKSLRSESDRNGRSEKGTKQKKLHQKVAWRVMLLMVGSGKVGSREGNEGGEYLTFKFKLMRNGYEIEGRIKRKEEAIQVQVFGMNGCW